MVFEKKRIYGVSIHYTKSVNAEQKALIAVLHIKVTVTPSPQSKIKILTSLQV